MTSRFVEQIAGDVLPHELVVGYIRVERPNQVVAVLPGALDTEIALVSL